MSTNNMNWSNQKGDNTLILVFFMLITLFISVLSTWFMINWGNFLWAEMPWVKWIVKAELNNHEYEKLWDKETYDLITEAQLLQMKQQIPQIKEFIANNKWAAADAWVNNTTPETQKTPENNLPEQKGKLEVFLMWYCPFWEIAAKQIPALFKQFAKDNISFDIHYIATKTWDWFEAKDFDSLHGVTEAEENIRQLCIKKEYWVSKLVDYQQVRYKNADNYGKVTDWPDEAITSIGWDAGKIATCVTWGEGGKLLAEDIKLAASLWVNGSPTWLANNKTQFGWIEWRKIAEEFCKYNTDLASCKEWIKIESNSSNPNSTPECAN